MTLRIFLSGFSKIKSLLIDLNFVPYYQNLFCAEVILIYSLHNLFSSCNSDITFSSKVLIRFLIVRIIKCQIFSSNSFLNLNLTFFSKFCHIYEDKTGHFVIELLFFIL